MAAAVGSRVGGAGVDVNGTGDAVGGFEFAVSEVGVAEATCWLAAAQPAYAIHRMNAIPIDLLRLFTVSPVPCSKPDKEHLAHTYQSEL
jgi:hypothetical protein